MFFFIMRQKSEVGASLIMSPPVAVLAIPKCPHKFVHITIPERFGWTGTEVTLAEVSINVYVFFLIVV